MYRHFDTFSAVFEYLSNKVVVYSFWFSVCFVQQSNYVIGDERTTATSLEQVGIRLSLISSLKFELDPNPQYCGI